jgi:hypothetical protein
MTSVTEPSDPGAVDQLCLYLDGADEPLARSRPPARIELDTAQMEDGPHRLSIEAVDEEGACVGCRTVEFEVRNGPAIEVDGLADGDLVDGAVSLMVHAWGGDDDWEPARAESPAPAPTWAWVLLIVILAWALFYAVSFAVPSGSFADAPTW